MIYMILQLKSDGRLWKAPSKAFKAGGSTTAGNSSQVTDGAAMVLLARRDCGTFRWDFHVFFWGFNHHFLRGEDEKEKYGVRFVRSLKNDGGWSALGVEFQFRCGVLYTG